MNSISLFLFAYPWMRPKGVGTGRTLFCSLQSILQAVLYFYLGTALVIQCQGRPQQCALNTLLENIIADDKQVPLFLFANPQMRPKGVETSGTLLCSLQSTLWSVVYSAVCSLLFIWELLYLSSARAALSSARNHLASEYYSLLTSRYPYFCSRIRR